jgi:BON domain-containing protein
MRTCIRRVVFAAAAGLLALSLGACSTTQSPNRQVDDSAIHTKVKARLTAAHFSNLTNIDVNVTNGVVTLSGEVPSTQIKKDAEEEVKKVDGVIAVNNNLQVKGQEPAAMSRPRHRIHDAGSFVAGFHPSGSPA